ncbi:peroxiredoxin-like family protein [Aquimarina sp. 2-A2]|uniref:peroxiredoxin-like family protein n=1 Tax=Aquimarina sp. 2-A2 TaxID=3382644 RepID=UPI00387EF0E4
MKETSSLQEQLDATKASFNAKASEDVKSLYSEGIEAVEKSAIYQNAKKVGDQAPDFTLNNAVGTSVTLSEYLQKGPVVLTWYRGGWCPYCNMTLRALQQALPDFKAEGASLIALTPEIPDKSMSTTEKHQLSFEVLSDVGNTIGRAYGIIFELIPELAESYQRGFDLHGFNGDASNELPLAATYVIAPYGKITYAFLDAEYRNRAEPSEILDALKALKS